MTWSDWSGWFVRLYGLGDRFAPTVALWVQEIFVPAGLTPDELHAAALAVARGGAPNWPSEILPALQEEIRRYRAAAILARDEQARLGGGVVGPDGCALCDGTGWAVVPHCPQPQAAIEKGFLATCAVSCRCHNGRRLNPRNGREEPSMTLDGYESQNPRWQEQMARERARRRAEWMAAGETSELGRLVDQLCRQHKRGLPLRAARLADGIGLLPAPEGGS